nr:DUF4054 domain-containing protein [uncultured Lichenicoccus sp.]
MSGTLPAPIVTFDPDAFLLRYPELALPGVENNLQLFFNEACIYCDNTSAGPFASQPTTLTLLLNMLTAHIAALTVPIDDPDMARIVGRLASGGEGSVNFATDYATPGSAAWFTQTRYGAAYWQATAVARLGARYYPSLRPPFGSYGWRQ